MKATVPSMSGSAIPVFRFSTTRLTVGASCRAAKSAMGASMSQSRVRVIHQPLQQRDQPGEVGIAITYISTSYAMTPLEAIDRDRPIHSHSIIS